MGRRRLDPSPLFDTALLAESLGSVGKSLEHARLIQAHALRSPDVPWEDMKGHDLPKVVVEMLRRDFARLTSVVSERRVSEDGTIKMLVRLQDGMEVETVLIPMAPGYATVCVSSQVGCAMGCTFCATGTMGLKGDLTAGEIVEQIIHAREASTSQIRVRNVVFMGMGEPLHNCSAVLDACRLLTDPRIFGLPRGGITVSTVGVVPGIMRVAKEEPWLRLAFSLHSPVQEQRQMIVPSAARYPLPDIFAALDEYLSTSAEKQVMIEFCVLRGKNDTEQEARRIGELLAGRRAIINLIPYNATSVKEKYQEPTQESVAAMKHVLMREFGQMVTIRQDHGRDIGGACGQLALQREGGRLLDIEDAVPMPRAGKRPPSPRRKPSAAPAAERADVRRVLFPAAAVLLLSLFAARFFAELL